MIWHVTQVGDERKLDAIGAKSEADRIGGVVGNGKGVDFDIADAEALPGTDGLNATQALTERVRQRAVKRIHGRFGDVQGRLPQPQHLWQPSAMIIVFVSNENAVEAIYFLLDSRQARQSFALTETGINQESGMLSLE